MHSPFADAFTPGCRFVHDFAGPIEVATRTIGDLKVPTGRIAASDPFTTEFGDRNEPLVGAAPTGVFPVEVALAKYDNGGIRVACARIRFEDHPAVRWEDLGQPDQFGGIAGYGVDSGTACFFDVEACGAVDEPTTEAWLDAFERNRVNSWGWHVADVGAANVVMFSTGSGDGIYESYWGYDADGQIVELVTDFGLLVGAAFERIVLPLPLPRGRFRHPLLEQHGVTMRVPLVSRSSAIVGSEGFARIELPDGTVVGAKRRPGLKWYLPSELQRWTPDRREYSWKTLPDPSHVVLAVVTGSKPLASVSP